VKLTRRELLTTFLGAPIALAACRRNAPAFPEGEIVGQSVELGHILREPHAWTVPDGNWQNTDVAIIGAGVAGLSAARRLVQSGVDDLVVLELEKAAGGTARSGEGDPVPYPWGAHYLPVPFEENQDLLGLLDEMDIFTAKGGREVREEFL